MSFSQCGEDLILRFLFQSVGIHFPRYLDIGAHHPFRLSNSALFYRLGARGVNIEPNPTLFKPFLRHRRKDVNLNVGVGAVSGSLEFYILDNPELSTFSRTDAESYTQKHGAKVVQSLLLPVMSINDVLTKYSSDRPFDIVSIDVEGLDEEILFSIDYGRFQPRAICVETVEFATQNKRSSSIEANLNRHGYVLYADTFINSIFIHRPSFSNLRQNLR